ncbi:hypothetical protein GBA52_024237 [Prunus armeniaca]|nr:hypothetical protein GBA52_024237 [Prunus armeniaca]
MFDGHMIEISKKPLDIFAIDRKIKELSISDCFSGAQVTTILQHGGGKAAARKNGRIILER